MRECDEVRGLLAGLVYDELPAGEKPRVEAHLSGCAECRAARESMREASSALDAWSLAPVRRKKATRRRVAPPARKPAVAIAWIAAAALFLLALALPFFTRSVDPAPAPITKLPVVPAAPLPPEREKARNEAQEELARIEAERKKARERLESIEREWEQLLQDKKKEAAEAQRQQARMQEERQKVEADLDRSKVAQEKAQEKLVRAEAPGTVAVVAMIDWAQGDVRVVTPAGKVPATPSKALVSGHGLETTGPDSVVVVKFPDSTRLELLGPATVRAISDGEEGKRVDLVAGAIKADVARQPAGKPMVFRTADAEVRVVGTRFRLVSQATTRIDLHEGKVRLTRLKDDASVEVAAGNTVTTGGPRLYPRPLREVSFQDGVSPAPTYAGTRDSFLSETNAVHNYGTNPTLQVDGDNPGGTGRELRMVLRWDVAPIPPGSKIQSAALVLYRSARSEPPYTVHAIRRAWNETDVNWQTLTGDRLSPALGFAIPVEEQFVFPLNADGIALVQSWIDAPAGNNGVLLIAPKNSSGMKAHSRESTEAAKRPKLVVTYTPR